MDLSFLNEYIPVRRSIRTFELDRPVEEDILDELIDFLSALTLPQSAIDWNFDTLPYSDMVQIATVEPGVKAPMYLVLRSEKLNFALQNCGYLGELASLWLTSRGIATCWQSSINVNEDFPDTLPYIAAIAMGYSKERFRLPSDPVKRKPLKKWTLGNFGDKDKVVEAVSMAPSWSSRQPVCLMSLEGKMHVYRNHPLLNNPVISYVQCIDVGAALAHMHVSANALGYGLEFTRQDPTPLWGNKIYQATVKFTRDGETEEDAGISPDEE